MQLSLQSRVGSSTKMLKVAAIIFSLLLQVNCSVKPVQKDNGIWFPGKSCGIKNEIKYLSDMPEDTSNLACTFVHADQPKRKSQEPQEPCQFTDTKFDGTSFFDVNPRPTTSKGCQEKCKERAECEFWGYHENWRWCRLYDSEAAAGNKKSNPYSKDHTIGSKNCDE